MYEGDDNFGEIFRNCEKFSKYGFYRYEGYLFKENKLCVPKCSTRNMLVCENAYKIELPGEYNVSTTFNVSNLALFDADGEVNLRKNPFEEGENDEDMTRTKGKEPLEGLGGPMTRARTKKAKEALQQSVNHAI